MEKNKIIKSLFYKFTERFAVKGVGMVISILLARLIAPEIFGQIIILTICANLSLTLIEGGLNTALVQSRECDDRDYSTISSPCSSAPSTPSRWPSCSGRCASGR